MVGSVGGVLGWTVVVATVVVVVVDAICHRRDDEPLDLERLKLLSRMP